MPRRISFSRKNSGEAGLTCVDWADMVELLAVMPVISRTGGWRPRILAGTRGDDQTFLSRRTRYMANRVGQSDACWGVAKR